MLSRSPLLPMRSLWAPVSGMPRVRHRRNVFHLEQQISLPGSNGRPLDTKPFGLCLSFAQARRIREQNHHPVEVKPNVDGPGRARLVGDDGHVAPREGIEKARLARIGRPHKTTRYPSRTISARRYPSICRSISSSQISNLPRRRERHHQRRPPGRKSPARPRLLPVQPGLVVATCHRARHVGHHSPGCEASLCFCLGSYEIGETLGLEQVDLAVDEGAACELSSFRQPYARQTAEIMEQGSDNRPTTVNMQFRNVFTSEAAGAGK